MTPDPSRRPHVLWVNHYAGAPADGTGVRHYRFANVLGSLGWDVTVAATDFTAKARAFTRRKPDQKEALTEVVGPGARFLWLWTFPYSRNDWRRGLNWMTFGRSLKAGVRPLELDLVVGSSPHPFAALSALRLARRRRIPFVLEVRDLWPESLLAAGGSPGPFHAVLEMVVRRLYREADWVMVLSEGVRGHLIGLGVPSDRIVFAPNAADVDREPRRAARGETFDAVYAGAHGSANDLDVVLDAAAVSLERGWTDLRYRLVGDGLERARLASRVEQEGLENVELIGLVPRERLVTELYPQADVGLMVLRPSPLFEFGISPNKLFEYMGSGLPVVCNVGGETGGIVSEATCGVVVEGGSGEALADGVHRLSRMEQGALRQLGVAGRTWVEENRDREKIGRDVDRFFRSVLR